MSLSREESLKRFPSPLHTSRVTVVHDRRLTMVAIRQDFYSDSSDPPSAPFVRPTVPPPSTDPPDRCRVRVVTGPATHRVTNVDDPLGDPLPCPQGSGSRLT